VEIVFWKHRPVFWAVQRTNVFVIVIIYLEDDHLRVIVLQTGLVGVKRDSNIADYGFRNAQVWELIWNMLKIKNNYVIIENVYI